MLAHFTEVFLPLFVALSPITVLPIYLSMTEGMRRREAQALSRKAVLTGLIIAVGIILAGQAIFHFLGITVDDLRVGGGVILLIIAIHDLIFTREKRKRGEIGADAGVVPLGTPLIVGPATMTTSVVLADTHGRSWVLAALVVNLLLIGLMLHHAHRVQRVVPDVVSRAVGKVTSLFLAAIAVAMLRAGIAAFVHAHTS